MLYLNRNHHLSKAGETKMSWLLRTISKIVIIGLTVFAATRYIEGIQVDDLGTAIFFSFILAVLNILVRPILVLITLPISILTFGLFAIVINTALFWFAGYFVEGMEIDGFLSALIGALIVSAVSWIFDRLFQRD